MKIAFDAQLVFEKQKTGIGWTADYILKNIIKEFDDNEYTLNYFSMRNTDEKSNTIEKYKKLGYQVNKCSWFHNVIYKKSWNTLPVPYSLFFGKKAQITQFFNYDVPPGVNGKAVTFVYDMVYKAFPQTMNKKTLDMLDYNLSMACKRADHIITISEFSKSEIIKYMNIPEKKISIMPCGVDLSIYHDSYSDIQINGIKQKYGIDTEYILYLGTLEPRKNIEGIIDAYALLLDSVKDSPKLVLAGKKGWLYDTIFKKVASYKLADKVIFTDYIDAEDAPILISGALMFVFPSFYEGFGLPPLEAMACGTPVIVSNLASLPEIVGDAGYYVNPYSINELKDGMENLLCNKDLRNDFSLKGLKRAKGFTWNRSVDALMNIYMHLCDENER